MTDGEHTQHRHAGVDGNCRVAEPQPHRVHLLDAYGDLLDECHRHRLYLALCGAELPRGRLPSLECEPGCERMVAYCLGCLEHAMKVNAEAAGSPVGAGADR